MALDQAGGVDYLVRTAEYHPGAFLALIGKVLPTTLAGDPESPIQIARIELVPMSEKRTG